MQIKEPELAIGKKKVALHNIEVKIAKLPKGSRNIPKLEKNRRELIRFLALNGCIYNPATMLNVKS